MRVLSVIHSGDVPPGLLASTARSLGHSHVQCSFALDSPPPEPLDAYDAVAVLGGTANVDERTEKPWIEHELEALSALLESNVPVLGVCLGAQLVATAAGATVTEMDRPEIGWPEIELTPQGRDDPILGGLPQRFRAFAWHSCEFELPPGAAALAHSERGLQAFRIDERAWAVQFHPEVTASTVKGWISTYGERAALDQQDARRQVDQNIAMWNEAGAALCTRFLNFAATGTGSRA